jgi:tetratricopeptide (TPR) repeat protein
VAQTRANHARFYLNWAEEMLESLKGAERKTALDECEFELANLRAAWNWAGEVQDVDALARYALPVATVFERRAQEGIRLFDQAAANLDEAEPEHQAALGAVLAGQAQLQHWLGLRMVEVGSLARRARGLLAPTNLTHQKLAAIYLEATVTWLQGDHRAARTLFSEGLALARIHGRSDEVGEFLINLGLVERELSDVHTVMTFYQDSLSELRTRGDLANLAHQLLIYGEYLVMHGRVRQGQEFLEESLSLALEMGTGISFFPFILLHLALAAYKLHAYDRAEARLYEALHVSQDMERTHPEALAHLFLGRVRIAQNRLPGARHHLQEGLRLGRIHSLTLVVTLALVCFAELHAAWGEPARAVGLLTVALNQEATEKRDRQEARHHLEALRQRLTQEDYERAVAEGDATTLDAAVEQLLDSRR